MLRSMSSAHIARLAQDPTLPIGSIWDSASPSSKAAAARSLHRVLVDGDVRPDVVA